MIKFVLYDKSLKKNKKCNPDTLKQETDIPVASYQTGSEKHSEDKGVPSLRILFENGKYTLPYCDSCREKLEVLVDELRGMAWDRGRVVSTQSTRIR